jgi:hypothetical protein
MGKQAVEKYSRQTGRLTVKEIESAISRAVDSSTRIELNDGGGLVLRCSPSGVATWSFAFRGPAVEDSDGKPCPGRMQRLTLGAYGKAPPALSLDAARSARRNEVARKKTGPLRRASGQRRPKRP